jgi:hypothetical protein
VSIVFGSPFLLFVIAREGEMVQAAVELGLGGDYVDG